MIRIPPRGLNGLATFAALAACPFVAMRLAELTNGWKDSDGDGMLDPFVNGAYDWFDVNGMDAMLIWVVSSFVVLIAGILLDRVIVQRSHKVSEASSSREG